MLHLGRLILHRTIKVSIMAKGCYAYIGMQDNATPLSIMDGWVSWHCLARQ
jgi:hypothetical protein